MTFRPAALIPVFNHPHRLDALVSALAELKLPVILVDDGSDATTAAVLDVLAARSDVILERLATNQGKGAAVLAGLQRAAQHGITHAVQIDADGQHDVNAVPRLVAAADHEPSALISGLPQYDTSVPKSRLYGRYISLVWSWIETLSFELKDVMCGFRVYPVTESLAVANTETLGLRMDFDNEIMVRLHWRGVPVRFIPVAVNYPEDGISHFKVWGDNWRISKMHTRLFFGMLWRLPRLLARKFHDSRKGDDGAWARLGERGSLVGMRIIAAVTRTLGTRVGIIMLHPVTLYFFVVHVQARRASRAYLDRVHLRVNENLQPSARPTLINTYRHFLSFSRAVFEKLTAWQNPGRLPRTHVSGGELLQPGKGMLLLSAHLGNLEMCRALARCQPDLKVFAVVYTRNARKFSRLMEEVNPQFHDRLILVEEMGVDTAVRLRTLIDQGATVVIVADRTPATENGHIVQTTFLGDSASFATGPYLLAHLLECPVGLLFCVRRPSGEYDVVLEKFAERIRLSRNARTVELAGYARRFAERLEYHVLRYPLQWFNFFNFWAGGDVQLHAATRPAHSGETDVNG